MPDPTTPAEEALEPCPFCGACLVFNPAFASGPVDGAFTHPFVMRYICPAEAVKVWPTALAFAAWNRRAPRPDALAVAVEPTEAQARAAYEAHMGPDPHAMFMRIATWDQLRPEDRQHWHEIVKAALGARHG